MRIHERVNEGIQLRQELQYAKAERIYCDVLEDYPEHERTIIEHELEIQREGKLPCRVDSSMASQNISPISYWPGLADSIVG